MHSAKLLLKHFVSTSAKISGLSFITLAGMLQMEDALLAFSFSTWCKASNVVISLKVTGSEGVNSSLILLMLGCLLYFTIAMSIGSSIPTVEDRWVSFSLIPSSFVILVK